VGLKKFAPYRAPEVKEKDRRKYGKKKRLREWRKKVKEEGEDDQIRAMLRPEKADLAPAPETKEAKKKRKSRKAKGKDVTKI
jgi:protein KRI1